MFNSKLLYNDDYFRYIFILMRYGFGVKKRRIRAKIFIYLEYEDVKFALINDKKRNRLLLIVFFNTGERFDYLGTINIYGYYPRQIRKILYYTQKKIKQDDKYRRRLIESSITISRKRGQNFKKIMYRKGIN